MINFRRRIRYVREIPFFEQTRRWFLFISKTFASNFVFTITTIQYSNDSTCGSPRQRVVRTEKPSRLYETTRIQSVTIDLRQRSCQLEIVGMTIATSSRRFVTQPLLQPTLQTAAVALMMKSPNSGRHSCEHLRCTMHFAYLVNYNNA